MQKATNLVVAKTATAVFRISDNPQKCYSTDNTSQKGIVQMNTVINKIIPRYALIALLLLCPTACTTYGSSISSKSTTPSTLAQTDAKSSGFLAIWRLLSSQQKLDFVSGYIHGWQDAARVTDVAIMYVRENPEKAVEGLEKIRTVYDLSTLKPDLAVKSIDAFYSNPSNSSAPFSKAISDARNR